MVAAIMRTCRGALISSGAAKQIAGHSLHEKISPATGQFRWSRVAKVLGPAHHISCALQGNCGNQKTFSSISLPGWGDKELCADFPNRHHKNTIIIESFPSEQLSNWGDYNRAPFTQLKICRAALYDSTSVEEIAKYLVKAGREYRTFDFQSFSNYTNSKRLCVFAYTISTDFSLVPPAIGEKRGPRVIICEQIPLQIDLIKSVVSIIWQFNAIYPFSLGLNK